MRRQAVHPFVLYELQRQYVAERQREAELRRVFGEGEPARTTRRRTHGGFSRLWLQRQSSEPARGAC
jgi:hypothetical protein